MNRSLYTQAVDSIKAPDRAVQKMLDTARELEKKDKVISMKNWKKTVIAASLAIAILLGGIFLPPAFKTNSGMFSLTVNAAEITDKDFTVIGTLDELGGDFSPAGDGSDNVSLTEFFKLDLNVDADNIENVVYTADCGSFGTNGVTDEDKTVIAQSEIVSDEEDDKNFTCLWMCADSADTTLPEAARQAVLDWDDHASYKLGEPTRPGYDDSKFSIDDCAYTIFSALLDRLSLNVDVTYTDGSTESRTLIFTCDSVSDGGVASIAAKLK